MKLFLLLSLFSLPAFSNTISVEKNTPEKVSVTISDNDLLNIKVCTQSGAILDLSDFIGSQSQAAAKTFDSAIQGNFEFQIQTMNNNYNKMFVLPNNKFSQTTLFLNYDQKTLIVKLTATQCSKNNRTAKVISVNSIQVQQETFKSIDNPSKQGFLDLKTVSFSRLSN